MDASGQFNGQTDFGAELDAIDTAVDEWAAEHQEVTPKALDDLRAKLVEEALRKRKVFGGEGEFYEEKNPITKTIEKTKGIVGSTIGFFRRHIGKILIGLGIIGVGAGVYTAKQAVDAARKTAKETVGAEFEEKKEEMIEFTKEALNTSGELAKEMMNFLILLKDKATNWDSVSGAVASLWKGIQKDAKEAWASGDLKPDQIAKSVKGAIANDPDLSKQWKKVTDLMGKMKEIPAELAALKESVANFGDEDKAQAWERFESNFWEEMKGPFAKKKDKAEVA